MENTAKNKNQFDFILHLNRDSIYSVRFASVLHLKRIEYENLLKKNKTKLKGKYYFFKTN